MDFKEECSNNTIWYKQGSAGSTDISIQYYSAGQTAVNTGHYINRVIQHV